MLAIAKYRKVGLWAIHNRSTYQIITPYIESEERAEALLKYFNVYNVTTKEQAEIAIERYDSLSNQVQEIIDSPEFEELIQDISEGKVQ